MKALINLQKASKVIFDKFLILPLTILLKEGQMVSQLQKRVGGITGGKGVVRWDKG